jgi:hypothetical protein
MIFVIVRIATDRLTMRLRELFVVGMGQGWEKWFTPPTIMVLTPKMKSVQWWLRFGTTVNGGNIAKTPGQQETILAAGVRAIAITILLTKLPFQRRAAAWPLQPAL